MSHRCHWPGCTTEVPPKLFACKKHWYTLPKHIRDRIWATYIPGQEVRKDPTVEYLDAAREARTWALEYDAARIRADEAGRLF